LKKHGRGSLLKTPGKKRKFLSGKQMRERYQGEKVTIRPIEQKGTGWSLWVRTCVGKPRWPAVRESKIKA